MVLQKKSDLFWQFFGSVTFLLVFFASLAFVSLVISRFSLRSETSEKTAFFRFEAKKNLLNFRIVSLQPKRNGAP
jgi:hypothetical protein